MTKAICVERDPVALLLKLRKIVTVLQIVGTFLLSIGNLVIMFLAPRIFFPFMDQLGYSIISTSLIAGLLIIILAMIFKFVWPMLDEMIPILRMKPFWRFILSAEYRQDVGIFLHLIKQPDILIEYMTPDNVVMSLEVIAAELTSTLPRRRIFAHEE